MSAYPQSASGEVQSGCLGTVDAQDRILVPGNILEVTGLKSRLFFF